MRNVSFALGLAALTLGGAGLSACNSQPAAEAAPPLAETQAGAILSDFAKAMGSMDLTAIDKWYANDIVAYEPGDSGRISGKVTMHVSNAQFVDMKFDKAEMPDPKIQILGPDLFIASGVAHLTSSAGKVKDAEIRYTEVFQKQADGSWQSIHENAAYPPES